MNRHMRHMHQRMCGVIECDAATSRRGLITVRSIYPQVRGWKDDLSM